MGKYSTYFLIVFFIYRVNHENFDTVPFELLNHEVTFRDLAFERLLNSLEIPIDYPEHLKSSIIKGVVEHIDISFNTKMEMSCSIVVDDNLYSISEIDLIGIEEIN
ncbi:hypothetical protein [Acinetobacter ursingii]|uniref:hypothetical protein n=1 Tax=Acinetobacter ursingii TaxID=108980 RepID=UPI003AF67120